MTKKISALIIVLAGAATAAFGAAADLPAAILIPTALEPSSAVDLTIAPAPVKLDLAVEPSVFAAEPQLIVMRPLPGFARSGDSGKALFDVNLLALIGLNIADYVSTREALKYPGLTEANPFLQPFAKSPAAFAALKIGTTALTYFSMKALFKKNRTVAWVLTTASNVFLSYVVANNLQRIHQARAI